MKVTITIESDNLNQLFNQLKSVRQDLIDEASGYYDKDNQSFLNHAEIGCDNGTYLINIEP